MQSPSGNVPGQQPIVCPQCGLANPQMARFCASCGYRFALQAVGPDSQVASPIAPTPRAVPPPPPPYEPGAPSASPALQSAPPASMPPPPPPLQSRFTTSVPPLSALPVERRIARAQIGQVDPASTQLFPASWLELWWVRIPAFLRHYSLLLSKTWQDGLYLTIQPPIAVALPPIAFLLGLTEGISHWNFLIGDSIIGGAKPVTFTELLVFMIFTAAFGALSANAGLLIVLGYAAGDFLIAGPQLSVYTDNVFGSFFTSLIYLRIPMLVSYILLFLLAVTPTLATRSVLRGLHSRLKPRGRVSVILQICVRAITQGAFVYLWTLSAPIMIRVLWSWVNSSPPLSAAYFLQELGGLVTGAAIMAALVRGMLTPVAYRDKAVIQRTKRLAAHSQAADRQQAFTRRIPVSIYLALGAAVSTLLISGIIGNFLEGLVVFGFITTLLILRRRVLPRLALWQVYVKQLNSIPLLLRLGLGAIIIYYLTHWILDNTFYLPVLINTPSGSFQWLLVSLCSSLLIMTLLLPGAANSSGPTRTVASSG